jgi:GTP-dependent phosphoenolpyruvate carboxykinase
VLGKIYTEQDYVVQFQIRIEPFVAKIQRILDIYREVPNAPQILFDTLKDEIRRLEAARKRHGAVIRPQELAA